MRILVTGHRGLVGTAFTAAAADAGHECAGFDLADGQDVRDADAIALAARGCDAVVHLAALDEPGDGPGVLHSASVGSAAEIEAVNVGGTANVLAAAGAARVHRIVLLSSVDVLGCFLGEGRPAYLPIDDAHPVQPRGAYARSKRAGELLVAAFADATAVPCVVLRAPGVFAAPTYEVVRRMRAEAPEAEWSPIWEYGAFIDVRDLATALLAAVSAPVEGCPTLLVNAADISSARLTSRELATMLLPDVPLRGAERFDDEPFRALVDCAPAQAALGWTPVHRWRPIPSGD